jgi:hypothetical protein
MNIKEKRKGRDKIFSLSPHTHTHTPFGNNPRFEIYAGACSPHFEIKNPQPFKFLSVCECVFGAPQ